MTSPCSQCGSTETREVELAGASEIECVGCGRDRLDLMYPDEVSDR